MRIVRFRTWSSNSLLLDFGQTSASLLKPSEVTLRFQRQSFCREFTEASGEFDDLNQIMNHNA